MLDTVFKQLGLSESEALVYEYLLNEGESTGGDVIKNTAIKRGTAYNNLKALAKMSLVEEFHKNNVAHFRAEHPTYIASAVETRKKEPGMLESSIGGLLPGLVSQYNLTYQKPAVRYYEGNSGMAKVLEDSLSAKNTILSYVDVEAVEKYIPDVNKAYVKKRDALELKKKVFAYDTALTRSFFRDYYSDITEVKLLPEQIDKKHETIMQIYDDKISYITLSDKGKIGVIIEDRHIFEMHDALFNHLWELTPEFVSEKQQQGQQS